MSKIDFYKIYTRHAENNLTPVIGNGGKLEWVNDGFCDDMNNNEACNYDGEDCCGILANKAFCLECKCISKSMNHEQLLHVILKNFVFEF